MTTIELYQLAEQHRIEVDTRSMRGLTAAAFPEGWVVIDPDKLATRAEVKTCLAHELGHCLTGSFYNVHSPCGLRGKQEATADRWAFRRLIPPKELAQALSNGWTEPWELAEHFEVPEPFLRRAMAYYATQSDAQGILPPSAGE